MIAELDEALKRPYLRPPEDREGILLNGMLRLVNRFQSTAYLRVGDHERAHADVLRALRLRHLTLGQHPNVTRFSQASFFELAAMPVLWEGLDSKAWNPEQLSAIAEALNEVHVAEVTLETLRSLRGKDITYATNGSLRREMNAGVRELHRKHGGQYDSAYPWEDRIHPQGWRYLDLTERLTVYQAVLFAHEDGTLNETTIHADMLDALVFEDKTKEEEYTDRAMQAIRDEESGGWVKEGVEWVKDQLNIPKKRRRSGIIVYDTRDTYKVFLRRAIDSHTTVSLARTAVALERYHGAHGRYPEALAALVPKFLESVPDDPWAENRGVPLRYQIRPNGRPAIWSVGDDRTDDNGLIDENRDVVWQYEPAPDDQSPARSVRPRNSPREIVENWW